MLPKCQKDLIGYYKERVDLYTPNLLRCSKCQKFGHFEDICSGQHLYPKCRHKDPNHPSNEYQELIYKLWRRLLCMFQKCEKWRTEKEILSIKYTKNVFFTEVCKFVLTQSYIGIAKNNSKQYYTWKHIT